MRRRGFTLAELLTVIAVIAILAAILFPVFARAREKARSATCASNLVNIGMCLRLYAAENEGRYPPVEDDLSPLLGKYLINRQVFMCPSNVSQNIPMGAPANPKLGLGGLVGGAPGGGMPPMPGGPPAAPKAGDPKAGPPGAPPGMPGGAPGGPPGGTPPQAPNVPAPLESYQGRSGGAQIAFCQDGGPPAAPPPGAEKGGPPGMPGGMPGMPPAEKAPSGPPPLYTGYYYRAGRTHNQLPRAPLCSDQEAEHNEGANVLFSDGNIKWLHKTAWEALGFRSLREIAASRNPAPPPGLRKGAPKAGGGDE